MSDYMWLIGWALGVVSTILGIIIGWFIANTIKKENKDD